jgi:hypothetical protein
MDMTCCPQNIERDGVIRKIFRDKLEQGFFVWTAVEKGFVAVTEIGPCGHRGLRLPSQVKRPRQPDS